MQETICLRRLKWSSQWVILALPLTCFAPYVLLSFLYRGYFSAPGMIISLILSVVGGFILQYCFQTVEISPDSIKVKLGKITLRTIPVSQIRSLVLITHCLGKGNTFPQRLIILSSKKDVYIRECGSAIIDEAKFPPKKLADTEEERENEKRKAYFSRRILFGYMKKEEGLWVYATTERTEQLRKALPEADFSATW